MEFGEGFDAEAELQAILQGIKEQRRAARLLELGGKPLAALSSEDRSELQRLLAERNASSSALTGESQVVVH